MRNDLLISIILLLLTSLVLNSCTLINEDDLSDTGVTILMPGIGRVYEQGTQTFWWVPLEGALNYHILIVKPDFDLPESIIADTSITANKFSIFLSQGEYEWCLQASNNYSSSRCNIYKLTIKEGVARK